MPTSCYDLSVQRLVRLATRERIRVYTGMMMAAIVLGGALAGCAWLAVGFLLSPDAMVRYIRVAPNLTDLLRSESYPSWGVQSLFGFSVLLCDGFSARAAIVRDGLCCGICFGGLHAALCEPRREHAGAFDG
jgi:hypothetical protein